MKGPRDGVTILEVVVAGALATVLGAAAAALIFRGEREVAISQDYMVAEALAQRHLADAMSRPWEELERSLPFETPLRGLPPSDAALGVWYPEYARRLGGPRAIEGSLRAWALEPGLVCFELELHWPIGPQAAGERSYALLRLRSRKDRALSSRFPLADPGGAP